MEKVMIRSILTAATFVVLLISGCSQPAPRQSPAPPNADGKVNVVAPGVNIEVKKDSKVDVHAPGVKVQVERK